MKSDNIEMLDNTLQILKQGYYDRNGKQINLKLSKKQMLSAQVFLPKTVTDICNQTDFEKVIIPNTKCYYNCENKDSFELAQEIYLSSKHLFAEKNAKEILVLNLANPVHPGGGVRRGARAQEEDLCRKSSLLLSLESQSAKQYYQYNSSLHTYMGSDALILSPQVEMIKDKYGNLLEETVIVSVLTCAAPCLRYGKEGMSEKEYQEMVYHRIIGMLKCAAYWNYKVLVLGAWGCGAFYNDAQIISALFYKAFQDLKTTYKTDLFQQVHFAVLDRTRDQYNFKKFFQNFNNNNFYQKEKKTNTSNQTKNTDIYSDKIRGCLYGGAVGDALGYPVEFMDEEAIQTFYGKNGIQELELHHRHKKALISDDTQMTLFTANGLLVYDTENKNSNEEQILQPSLRQYVRYAYLDWLRTQKITFAQHQELPSNYRRNHIVSWLCDVPELYSKRAPGNTCISSLLRLEAENPDITDYISSPENHSKGCGGIMRVAPLALNYKDIDIKTLDLEGAQIAAITHGHSLGYMPAAVLTHILHRLVFDNRKLSLKEIVIEARDTIAELFSEDIHLAELTQIIDLAIELSENTKSDLENINSIGQGWVAEETLGIAIYCSLRHQNNFSAGLIASVNHQGDSDSTGAVTGNILGALLGYHAIEEKWKKDLELADVILEIADDISKGCPMCDFQLLYCSNKDWARKYLEAHWKEETN